MSCKDIKKLIYLRDDELSISERTALHNHLKKCATCQTERQAFLQEIAIVDSARQEPELMDPDLLTIDIMRSIRNVDKFSKRRHNPFDKLLDIFSLRSVRFVFATGVLFICGFFLTQEMTVLNRLHHLEQRLAQHGTVSSMSTMTGTTKDILSLMSNSDETVVIDKELLEEFLKSYSDMQMKNRLLLRKLQEQAEESNITWQDGLTEKELESLLKSESVQQKLKEL
jgi:hypothetical protein